MKHIHFIGICGVAMSALAIALQKAGHKVTGSDAGFYPPVSTMLEKCGIEFYPGWHPEKMGTPDLVIVGNVASSTNPEWVAVQEQKIPYASYPEAIADFWVKGNSIVCAGTYGKTTTAALLAWIFTELGHKPSYMFGGLAGNDFPAAALTDTHWSILEGDEYKSARWDNRPKFAHYSPKFLLLTAISWDHADVYPTYKSYLAAFKTMIDTMPTNGAVIVNADDEAATELAYTALPRQVVTYGKNPDAIYRYSDVKETKDGLEFTISSYPDEQFPIKTKLMGAYQAENITGAFAIADQILLEPAKIAAAIATFPGLKRRLEKRFEGKVTVFDDIAHSPTKAKHTLETLRKMYTGKIVAVFEPNTGNRKPEAMPQYNDAFANASEVIIPRLTKVKIDANDPTPPVEGDALTETIKKTQPQVMYIDDDNELVNHLAESNAEVIVFLGSHGFRGMIDELIKKYENS